jgi:hypothetical protein
LFFVPLYYAFFIVSFLVGDAAEAQDGLSVLELLLFDDVLIDLDGLGGPGFVQMLVGLGQAILVLCCCSGGA